MLRHILLFLIGVYPLISAATPTELKLYRPFGQAIDQVQPAIGAKKAGVCLSRSQRITRAEAWRCKADDGVIYDPCFVKAGGKAALALCINSPWDNTALLLTASKNLRTHRIELDLSTALPWAIELNSGEHCLATDRDEVVDGLPVHYRCSDATVLIGFLQRCREEWKMLQKNNQGIIATKSIKKAWF